MLPEDPLEAMKELQRVTREALAGLRALAAYDLKPTVEQVKQLTEELTGRKDDHNG